jgi:uncharacterized membrane protein YphA (DoxX/SURF4 family)
MKILSIVCRIIVGLVFIFSGTVKAIDPQGSAYKFHDYFQAFHLDSLDILALPLAVLLCAAEFISGISVLTGFRQKAGIWGVTILILIFTPLTFHSCTDKSCIRLWLFWRCNTSFQLANIWQEYCFAWADINSLY